MAFWHAVLALFFSFVANQRSPNSIE